MNGRPQKAMFLSSEPENVTLFGKTVFEGVIKDLKMRSTWIIQVDPKSNDECPRKKKKRVYMKIDAEIGVMQPQRMPPEPGGGKKVLPYSFHGVALKARDFSLLVSRAVGE